MSFPFNLNVLIFNKTMGDMLVITFFFLKQLIADAMLGLLSWCRYTVLRLTKYCYWWYQPWCYQLSSMFLIYREILWWCIRHKVCVIYLLSCTVILDHRMSYFIHEQPYTIKIEKKTWRSNHWGAKPPWSNIILLVFLHRDHFNYSLASSENRSKHFVYQYLNRACVIVCNIEVLHTSHSFAVRTPFLYAFLCRAHIFVLYTHVHHMHAPLLWNANMHG